ncbi:MAG: hypothetical protein ACSNEK_09895 [Parachlamydiaceae bacterium]
MPKADIWLVFHLIFCKREVRDLDSFEPPIGCRGTKKIFEGKTTPMDKRIFDRTNVQITAFKREYSKFP